jgi:7-alpha-hydroxysteroid dehydrogenase
MAADFAGRSVIVTGAARGVGLAIAERLVRAGASVVCADADEARLEREVATIGEMRYEGRVQAFAGDLREKLTMTNLVAATLEANDGIDVLVNASRILATSDPLNPDGDRLEATLAQNVTATLRLTQIVARRMIEIAGTEQPGPADRAIVNLSSIHATRTAPSLLAYSVSCAAIDQLTRTLALALAPHRIRVNAIAVGGLPGRALAEALPEIDDIGEAIAEVTPLGRTAEPGDFVDAALFLASPGSAYVTGQVLSVDGGRALLDPLYASRP